MRDITVSGVKYFSSDYTVKQGSRNVMKSVIETIWVIALMVLSSSFLRIWIRIMHALPNYAAFYGRYCTLLMEVTAATTGLRIVEIVFFLSNGF